MGLLLALLITADPDGGRGLVPAEIELRAVDDQGLPMKNVGALFFDRLHLSGKVTAGGCGTVNPQQDLYTGDDGRAAVTLPFTPTHYEYAGGPEGYECEPCGGPLHGSTLTLKLHRIPYETVEGAVLDGNRQPLEEATVSSNCESTSTNVAGRFSLRYRSDRPEEFRVRKMGFKPVVVKKDQLMSLVLTARRTFITVQVTDPKTKLPATTVRVSLWKREGQQSFCTTNSTGACRLDADPGTVELRIAGLPKRTLQVGTAELTVSVDSPQPDLGTPH